MAATGSLVESLCNLEPHAIIANCELQGGVSLVQLDPDVPRPCMPDYVGQSLLNCTEADDRQIAGYIVQQYMARRPLPPCDLGPRSLSCGAAT
jgi:hypothetical protein